MSAQDRPRVIVVHWVHPEVADYLATFCDPVLPGRPGQVFAPGTRAWTGPPPGSWGWARWAGPWPSA